MFVAYFFVSWNIHIKCSPNVIKNCGVLFWNICDFWEEESTQDGARGGHKPPRRTHVACGPLVSRLTPFFRNNKDYIRKKCVKISAWSELWISENLRIGFQPENKKRKTEENR